MQSWSPLWRLHLTLFTSGISPKVACWLWPFLIKVSPGRFTNISYNEIIDETADRNSDNCYVARAEAIANMDTDSPHYPMEQEIVDSCSMDIAVSGDTVTITTTENGPSADLQGFEFQVQHDLANVAAH